MLLWCAQGLHLHSLVSLFSGIYKSFESLNLLWRVRIVGAPVGCYVCMSLWFYSEMRNEFVLTLIPVLGNYTNILTIHGLSLIEVVSN